MSKIIYAVLTAFAIELGLYLFVGQTTGTSSLFGMLVDPSGLVNSALYSVVTKALLAIGASTIIIGTFYNINIYGIYAAVAAVLISFVLTIAHLWTFIAGQLVDLKIAGSSAIATIICAPILLAYIIITLNYVRANE